MFIEFFGDLSLYQAMGIKVAVAGTLGLILGVERESKLKGAGLKTNMLICLGACLFVSVSLMIIPQGHVADPNRLAAQVVSGIGFLGAGAIMKGKEGVSGLTTAATIWLSAAIGVSVGCGYIGIASIFTITVVVVLRVIDPLFTKLQPKKDFVLRITSHESVKNKVVRMFDKLDASVIEVHERNSVDDNYIYLKIACYLSPKCLKDIQGRVQDMFQVDEVTSNSPLVSKKKRSAA